MMSQSFQMFIYESKTLRVEKNRYLKNTSLQNEILQNRKASILRRPIKNDDISENVRYFQFSAE